MATSNIQTTRKIKPIDHPGLVLKTPIAYHGGSDLSVLPIDKDGIAVCEKCGAIGVKHAFYTRQRKFCSVVCARGYTGYYNTQKGSIDNAQYPNEPLHNLNGDSHCYKKQPTYKFKLMDNIKQLDEMIPIEPLPQLPDLWQPSFDFMQLNPIKLNNINHTHEWSTELFRCDFLAAPVSQFHHAPLSNSWDNTIEGMKVEVKNRDCDSFSGKASDYFWVATVLKLKGYMGLLRYEGFGNDDSKDFWVNLMCSEVHPVGWCATRGKPLIPPESIENKYSDWKNFLVKQLTGARTLPTDFYSKITESLKSRFRIGQILEVVDKNRISQVKVSTIHEIVGKRLNIRYYDSTSDDIGFWCHEDSPLIHHVGWARDVGHLLDAPFEYIQRLDAGLIHPDDTTVDLFKFYVNYDPHNINFRPNFVEGMKLEAIDPLNLSSICVATVMRVLLHGNIMVRIDSYPPDEKGNDWFCYHENSPFIFPVGFCAERGIPLTLAAGQMALPPASPVKLAPSLPQHGFVSGMHLECVDLMDPRLVCVATVSRIVGRLLKIHFDGWGDEYDQWLDCESTDIYPVGWCKAVGHKLEAPFVPAKQPAPQGRKRRGKKRLSKPAHETIKPQDSAMDNGNTLDHIPDMVSNHDMAMFDSMATVKDEISQHFEAMAADMDEAIKQESPKSPLLSNILDERHDLGLDDDRQGLELHNNLGFDITDIDDRATFTPADDVDDCLGADAMDIDNKLELPDIISEPKVSKNIPRLVGGFCLDASLLNEIDPESWDTEDVGQFLSKNDCAAYCENFCQVSGKTLLELSKDEIIELLQMKVGPSLKIYDLVQQLKCKLKPGQSRLKSAFK